MIVIREMTNKEGESAKISGNAIILKLLLALISCVVCVSITYIASRLGFFKGSEALPSSIYLASGFLLFSFGSVYNCIFQANMRLGLPALFSVVSRILSLSSLIILIYFFDAPLILIVFVFLIFGIPNVLMGMPEMLLLRRCSRRFMIPAFETDIPLCKKILKDALPLALSSFFIIIYTRIDQLMIKFWYSFADLAPYAVAVRLSDVALIIPHAFMTAVFPILSRFYQNSEDQFKNAYSHSFRFMLAVSIFMASIFTLYPDWLLTLFYSEEYRAGSASLVILSWALVFVFAGIVNNRILVSAGLQRYDLLFTGLSAVINVILNLFFIPHYGIEGAAVATLFAYGTGPFIGLFLEKTRDYSRAIFRSAARPLVSSIVTLILVYPIREHTITSGLIAAVIFFGLMLLLRGITKKDYAILQEIFRSKSRD